MGNPVTHFEIVGEDAQALQNFYKEAFGWEVVPAGPAYAMVHPQAGTGIDGGVAVPQKALVPAASPSTSRSTISRRS